MKRDQLMAPTCRRTFRLPSMPFAHGAWAGAKFVSEIPGGKPVSMCVHQGQLYIATEERIYRLGADDVLVPLRFET